MCAASAREVELDPTTTLLRLDLDSAMRSENTVKAGTIWKFTSVAFIAILQARLGLSADMSLRAESHMDHIATPIAIFGDENRTVIDDWASRDKMGIAYFRKHYPTGQVVCGDDVTVGSVVVKRDILLTVAHMFFDATCALEKTEESRCFFNDYNGDQYKLDMNSLRTGLDLESAKVGLCQLGTPTTVGQDSIIELTRDWVVIKLKKPVKNVVPYGVTSPPLDREGKAYMMVAAAADNFPNQLATTYQLCSWRDTRIGIDDDFAIYSDCDSGLGSSGSPLINEKHEIEAIQTKVSGSGKPENSPYNPYTNYNVFIPMNKKIYESIKELAEVAP